MERETGVLSAEGEGAGRCADRQPVGQHPDAGLQRSDSPVRVPLQTLTRSGPLWIARFRAMGGPCEVLVETEREQEARQIAEAVTACAGRIEHKYSRYRTDNLIAQINTAQGSPVTVDEETANLLDFSALLHSLSGGMFDITSGVLRRAWSFDGRERIPTQEDIEALLPLVGWQKVKWTRPVVSLLPGMQIDFGGVAKEYAVDQAARAASIVSTAPTLVNFGGDLAVTRARSGEQSWRVGIEGIDEDSGHAARL